MIASRSILAHPRRARRAYTLVEMLITVVILAIAAALVIPSMGQTGVLRVQGALRMVVSDLTTAQSDAVASKGEP
jgi:prepilin-type N-terminal cleavage/methylation domain-containing protein